MRTLSEVQKCRSLLQLLVNSRGTRCGSYAPSSLQNLSWKPGAVIRTLSEGPTKIIGERPWNNTLLSSSVALSADSESNHLFITDTQRHRIIIADGRGKILDCIGSSPGMRDGTFEMAELHFPASTVFDPKRRFLYIADSENHAIRRADLAERIVVTVYPPTASEAKPPMWKRLLGWMRSSEPHVLDQTDDVKENCDVLKYPWHLKVTEFESLLVTNSTFESIWDLDYISGVISKFQTPDSEVRWEEYMAEGVDLKDLDRVNKFMLQETREKRPETAHTWQKLSVSDFVSRAVRLQNTLVFAGRDGVVRKYDFDIGAMRDLEFSNLGRLGLPWWWRIHSPDSKSTGCSVTSDRLTGSAGHNDDSYRINIQPGRRLLCIHPMLQGGTILAAPLEEGSIWRQARGSVVELSMFEGSLISRKVSSAQQWLDDLDDLDDLDSETEDVTIPERTSDNVNIYCLVDTSPGVGEVIIDAVLYVKSAKSQDIPQNEEKFGSLESYKNQKYLRHLHVRLHLEIASSAPNEEISTVNVRV